MPADPQSPLVAPGVVQESLVDFEAVIIRCTRPAVPPKLDGALHLRKDSYVGLDSPIRVQEISLQRIAVGILRTSTKREAAEVLVTHASFSTEADVAAALARDYVFYAIE